MSNFRRGRIALFEFVLIGMGAAAIRTSCAATLSDVVIFTPPGGNRTFQFYDEANPAQPEFTPPALPFAIVANTGVFPDTLLRMTEPFVDPDLPDVTLISDTVAMKNAPGNQLQFFFWSDNSTLTETQFEQGLGLVNPVTIQTSETGYAQDVSGLLFGAQPPPLNELFVDSDVFGQVLTGPNGIGPDNGGLPGWKLSDIIIFRKNNSILNQGRAGNAFFDDKPGENEFSFNVFTSPPIKGLSQNINNAAMEFEEALGAGAGEPDNEGMQTDLLAMRRAGDCTDNVTGCTLTFSVWSEDPLAQAAFLAIAAPGAVPVKNFSENGHPPVFQTLFQNPNTNSLNNADLALLPFDDIDFSSDPPVPEPASVASVLGGFAALGLYYRRRQRRSLERMRLPDGPGY